ncbi:MAG: type II toxin-antitoxin system VapC family toxin [Planctomycetes bacterium]|nr:type II toxin-antitoxin system VapC family toxin [Planctomycetota bacterium]
MFWDTLAIIPVLVVEAWSRQATDLLNRDANAAIWWGTPVECASALERRKREGGLSSVRYREAYRRLARLQQRVDLVQPHPVVRDRAIELLKHHPLRAGDALQLAAALIYFEARPASAIFVCLDSRLRHAASQEGLHILPEKLGTS